MRAVGVDVIDSVVQAVDQLDRQNRREVFGAPVGFGGFDERSVMARVVEHGAARGIHAQLHVLRHELASKQG